MDSVSQYCAKASLRNIRYNMKRENMTAQEAFDLEFEVRNTVVDLDHQAIEKWVKSKLKL